MYVCTCALNIHSYGHTSVHVCMFACVHMHMCVHVYIIGCRAHTLHTHYWYTGMYTYCSLYVHGVLFVHIEVGNTLSEVPHHSGTHVPSHKSTYGTKGSLKAHFKVQHKMKCSITICNVPTCTNPCMLY